MLEVKTKKDTINVTSRMSKSLYDLLVKESDDQGISLNSLINSIIKKHLSWETYANKIGFVPLTKRAIRQLYNVTDLNTIKKIAHDVGTTVPSEMLALTFTNHELANIIQLIEVWASRFGIVKTSTDDSSVYINIHHGICKNFSEYVAELHRAMAESMSFKIAITKIDEMYMQMKIGLK